MIITWNIRYYDEHDKQFYTRHLYLDTDALSLEIKAAVELEIETKKGWHSRGVLKYRSLFLDLSPSKLAELGNVRTKQTCVALSDYFEDKNGKEITLRELGPLLTGRPDAIILPHGAEEHDIELLGVQDRSLDVADIKFLQDDLELLGTFCRDLEELAGSAFQKHGPGTISGVRGGPVLETAVTVEQINSYVMTFRRLYLAKEPANFIKAAEGFEKAIGKHPYAKWLAGERKSYEAKMSKPPEFVPFLAPAQVTFTRKRLLDVCINGGLSHQGDKKTQKQYAECLRQVGGKEDLLYWLFLTEIWKCGLQILNAGRFISSWFHHYLNHHSLDRPALKSISSQNPRIGILETQDAREQRLFEEKANDLAVGLWKEQGEPEGGPLQFLELAKTKLKEAQLAPAP